MKYRRKFHFSPRMLLIFLTVICGALLVVSVAFKEISRPFTNIVGYVVVPMQSGINTVGTWISDHAGSLRTMRELQEENKDLAAQVEELTRENERLSDSQQELVNLQELLALKQEYADYHTVGARVISSGGGNWYTTFLVNKGSDDGIKVDMNVLSGNGLVGIVTETGRNYAKIRTIIDDESRVSAKSLKTGDTCVVRGDMQTMQEEGMIRLVYISKDASMMAGEELVTSNISSKYLPGIRIGTASDIVMDSSNLTKSGRVYPVADFQHIEQVLIITDMKEVPSASESAD